MTNKDTQMERAVALAAALRGEDEDATAKAFAAFAEGIEQKALAEARALADVHDAEVLKARGVRVLTSSEKEFYQSVISAIKSNPQQSLTTTNMRLPETVVDQVLGDVTTRHELLEAVDFTATTMLTTWDINLQGPQAAVWGDITATIATELNGNVSTVQIDLKKLSAFFPISVAWLDLGPAFLDRYIREILAESIALGAENAIITGNGLKGPIGMDRNLAGAVDQTTGYPKKDAIAVTSFDPAGYGALVAGLLTDRNGKYRDASDLILVVNPLDYYTLVMPATTRQLIDGGYVHDIFPIQTKVIKAAGVTRGEAILGLGKNYWFGVGAGTNGGKIESSDEYKFLEDMRYYKVKMYGNGRPLDNTSFLRLDISGLVPYAPVVGLDASTIDAVTPEIPQVITLLTVTSEAGSASGKTAITVAESKIAETNAYKYKTSSASAAVPVVGTKLGAGYTAWDGTAEITATTGHYIVIVEVDVDGIVAAVGYTTVTSAT